MPFPGIHQLFTFHGTLPGGEQWTNGIRAMGGTLTEAQLVVATQEAADVWRTMVVALNASTTEGRWSAETGFVGVTGRQLNGLGVTLLQVEAAPTTPPSAGGTATRLPNQCAVVATLLTAKAGRTGKGRIYLPLLGNLSITGGRTLAAAEISTAVSTMLSGLNAAWETITPAIVTMAACVGSQKGAGDFSVINGVKVGNVIDTQRRRRSDFIEAYSQNEVDLPSGFPF